MKQFLKHQIKLKAIQIHIKFNKKMSAIFVYKKQAFSQILIKENFLKSLQLNRAHEIRSLFYHNSHKKYPSHVIKMKCVHLGWFTGSFLKITLTNIIDLTSLEFY